VKTSIRPSIAVLAWAFVSPVLADRSATISDFGAGRVIDDPSVNMFKD
jgi:hypothetical protein